MTRPFAISLDPASSRANHTGSWRTARPIYVANQPPCNDACPAGEDIQGWLYRAEEGDYEGAWRILTETNPFPAIAGRVCYRPCQTACNRAQVDEAVGINAVERFLGDEALRRGWRWPAPAAASGRRVLVVGAGPCGLSAAYHLARAGHAVTVADAEDAPGGMMRTAIPTYRLPRSVVDQEIDRLLELGVELQLRSPVADLEAAWEDGGHDAVLVAVGARLSRGADIPSGDAARIVDALGFLRSVEEGHPVQLGRRVAVYGGGDTALDVARSARRLGATDPVVVYRRTRERMPAHDQEVREAEDEGVRFRWLSTVRWAGPGRVVLERMVLDEAGDPQPTGEVEELPADSVVLALGQDTDLRFLERTAGVVTTGGAIGVGADLMTGRPGVFAGGDAIAGDRTVTAAVGHGRRAAGAISRWLAGEPAPPPAPGRAPATFEQLNTWYYSDAPHAVRPALEAARRQGTFDEVVGGLDAPTALYEARRCMSCGNCIGCDNCYAVCPDNAVLKLPDGGYEIDLDFCKGCGLCVAECPCGSMAMVDEDA